MRKGHGSTKVPGVKLRPAAPKKPGAKPKEQPQAGPSYLADDGITEDDILKSSKKPFAGVVICASGVPEKATTFAQAVELGAQTSSDLTDRVTHLITLGPGSAKYAYCVRHGIPIMHPSWITKSHGKWIAGESIDSKSDALRLPVFASATICLTGIDNIETRTQIHKLVTRNGGVFVKDLTTSSGITHLLCGSERGLDVDQRGWTRKMQHVERFNEKQKDRKVKVNLVWEEWFWDCLEFKGQLDEVEYDVNKSRPKRKDCRDTTPLLQPISSLADLSAASKKVGPFTPIETIPELPDNEELAIVKRPPDAASKMWGGLMKNRGLEMRGNSFVRSTSKTDVSSVKTDSSRSPPPPLLEDHDRPTGSEEQHLGTMLSAFRRTKSFAPSTGGKPTGGFSEATSVKSVPQADNSTAPVASSSSVKANHPLSTSKSIIPTGDTPFSDNKIIVPPVPIEEQYLFVGYKFALLGEIDNPQIRQEVKLRGGDIVEGKRHADFILVRLFSGKALRDGEQDNLLRPRYRTECWLEQCIFEERVCEAGEHAAFTPLECDVPLAGAQHLKVHISGFPAHQKTMTTRLIKAIGATIADQLSRKTSQMISTSNTSAKYLKAKEWNVPCVSVQWLHDSITAGKILSPEGFDVDKTADASKVGESRDETALIRDITNDDFVQGSSKGKYPQKGIALTESARAIADEPTGTSSMWQSNGLLSDASVLKKSSASLGGSSSSLSRKATEIVPPEERQRPASPTKEKADPRRIDLEFPVIDDDDQGRVPSSNTPSPLKAPTAAAMSSPTKQSTHALKSAITSLLGKRHASDECDSSGQSTRASKKSKPPPRSKSNGFSRTSSTSTDPPQARGSFNDYPLFSGDAVKPFNIEQASQDQSMRVTYEDPHQRDEKNRLMSLLSAGGGLPSGEAISKEDPNPSSVAAEIVQAAKKGRNLVRRSTRKSGF